MPEPAQFLTAQHALHSPYSTAILWENDDSGLFSFLPSVISWQRWQNLVATMGNFLHQRGMLSEQLVIYCGSHRLAGVLCYCGVLAFGGRIMALNPALTTIQQQHILADYPQAILLTDQDFADFPTQQTACDFPLLNIHQPATFTLTSGSSGKPKAVVHSIAQHLANAKGVCELTQFHSHHQWLLSLPLYHVSGQGILWRWLFTGAVLTICENKQHFNEWLARSSHASLVPTQLHRYLNEPLEKVIPQHILLGGAYIPPSLIIQAQQHNITTYAGYGMTEMASTICAVKNDSDNVGYSLIGREIQIVEQEIWVRGETLALGYWQDNQIQPLLNEQGWFPTKDKGYLQPDGKLVVQGRMDNMFISGGENIQPEEIERVLLSSNLLKNIVIVPLADEEFGDRPVAFIACRDFFSKQAVEKVQFFAKQHLEKFKQPIHYLPLESERWQANGIKISRSQLKLFVADYLREKQYV